MNYSGVLKRAWHVVRSYRALWLFGIIFALVTFSWETAMLLDGGEDRGQQGVTVTRLPGETFPEAFRRTVRTEVAEANRELSELLSDELGLGVRVDLLRVIAVLVGIGVVVTIAAKIGRYVSETALIRMVGAYDETGERLSVRQGLRLGWSPRAWRLFLVNLIIDLLAAAAAILFFTLIFAPLPLWVNGAEGIIFGFAFLTAGLFFLGIALVIVLAALTSVWKRLARQACALEGIGVIEAIRRGFNLVRQYRRETGLAWLTTAGVGLGWTAAIVPLLILLLGVGFIIGGLPGLAAAGLARGNVSGEIPVFVGLAVGLPILLVVIIGPLVFLDGLREVFVSALWTLTYRGLISLAPVERERVPELGAPGLEVASSA